MYVSFEEMADDARIWIYQADRPISAEEHVGIRERTMEFVDNWTAHGVDLKSSFQLFRSQFLVLAVDRNFNETTGCSIDASVHFVQDLEREFGIDFFNRSNIAYLQQDKIRLAPLQEIKHLIQLGDLDEDTLTFNNVIQYKEDMKERWLIPVKESWIKRYF